MSLHKVYNTFHLFESVFYNEIIHYFNIKNKLFKVDELINTEEILTIEILDTIFDAVWAASNSIEVDEVTEECFILDVFESKEHEIEPFMLMKEFNDFHIDYNFLVEIKDYIYNTIKKSNNRIRVKNLYFLYIRDVKNVKINEFRLKMLVNPENINFN